MHFSVLLTDDAVRDLEDIYDYIDLHDSRSKADHVLERIEKAFDSLSKNPERGVHPRELIALGLRDFRQIFFKPYRIIYRMMGNNVYVLLIADGRRDMQKLLQRRLIQA
jgi:toxin ParE1/3/4